MILLKIIPVDSFGVYSGIPSEIIKITPPAIFQIFFPRDPSGIHPGKILSEFSQGLLLDFFVNALGISSYIPLYISSRIYPSDSSRSSVSCIYFFSRGYAYLRVFVPFVNLL